MSSKFHDDSQRSGSLPRVATHAHQVHDAQGVADRNVPAPHHRPNHDGRALMGQVDGVWVVPDSLNCRECGSGRTAHVLARCSDMCGVQVSGRRHHGYVPRDLGIGGGDDVQFTYCLDCGRIQGAFPLSPTSLEEDHATAATS